MFGRKKRPTPVPPGERDASNTETIALGALTSPMQLFAVIREGALVSITNRIAAVWQEQHPQQHMPASVDFKADILVDIRVVNGLVDDITADIVRKLEVFAVEVPR